MAVKKEVKRIVKQLSLKQARDIISSECTDVDELAGAYIVVKKAMEVYQRAVEQCESVIKDVSRYVATFGSSDPVIIEVNGEAIKLTPGTKTTFVVDKDALTYEDLPAGIVKTEVKLDHKLLRKAYVDGVIDGGIDTACHIESNDIVTIHKAESLSSPSVVASVSASTPKED